uniref:Aminopeptidase N n=1 Tax=Chilo infuscatellus TaxID=236790 RepID=A0A4D6WGR8_9NEOP|nr:aminopeptidase N [Chilo infuscatellus]
MMAHQWVLRLVFIALIQGVLLLSPIPVPDQEWEQFNELLRNPAYRLVRTTVPRHYEVSLTPYFDTNDAKAFTFEGHVKIYISPTEENVNQIIMHCNDLVISSVTVAYTDSNNATVQIQSAQQDLTCSETYSFLTISTSLALQLGVEYEVDMDFTGRLQTNMRGFYRSWYNDDTGRRWMGTTQFQPSHARQAFPCYDEPSFKATFDITINREPEFSPSLSNMPIKQTSETLVPGRVSETFYTTPLTSTYLLAFIVSHYKEIEKKDEDGRTFSLYARNNAGTTGEWAQDVGIRLLREMEEYTQIPYYTMADNIDMKQAAIPDFSAGAMENWGLLTYREALILYDPKNSNHFYKQRVANIVSHEIAHMWFGNLVTCAWWDNLWLNEGFARFYQYFLTAKVEPNLGYETRFISEQFFQAMTADSVDSAHALTNPTVNSPSTVSAHFSAITYARGACILRMTQHLLSEATFVKGLRKYLDARKFDVAEPHHLFEALDAAAAEDNALGSYGDITIDRYLRSWSEKAGHPLLTVTINQATGVMTVKQSRWERTNGTSQYPSLWDIPITWTRGSPAVKDFAALKPSQIITDEITVIDRGYQGLQWVIFNKQASGFYRVNYDRTNWALLTQALRANVKDIHEYNRAQIIDDTYNFGRAGIMSYDRVFNIISFLEFDDEYAPWMAAIDAFNFLLRRLAHDEINLKHLQDLIIDWSKTVTGRLGFTDIENEPFMDGLLRMYVMQFLCNIGHQECVRVGKETFAAWKENNQHVPANMRPWVYCIGLREGGVAEFDFFWEQYLKEDLASEQVVMIQAAGCTTDKNSLEKFLNAIVDETEIIRPQDTNTAFSSAVSRNEINTKIVFEWLKNNIDKVAATFGSVQSPLNSIAARLLTEAEINEFETWLEQNQEIIGSPAFTSGMNGAASARSNLAWSVERTPELVIFFENGYEEEDLDNPGTTTPGPITEEASTAEPISPESTTVESSTPESAEPTTQEPTTAEPTTAEPTTEEPTTPEGGGAATIALSLAALTVSVAITFLN